MLSRHALLQVTTFKVRTVSAHEHGSAKDPQGAAKAWERAPEPDLDAAAGGHGALISRAMSLSGAGTRMPCQ
jgi:hypothetical protein